MLAKYYNGVLETRLITDVDAEQFADFDQHKRVVKCIDKAAGLTAYIAVHNLNLGPALGGCRIFPYDSDKDAIIDVLRLSRGMTYKSALANLKLGGGKAVILADPKLDKTPEMMRAMGRFVETLRGDYITAEDSGTSVEDLETIGTQTAHTAGVKTKLLSDGTTASGDPSPSTAYGVFVGIRASVKARFGSEDLSGIKVAVQGVGNVGRNLVKLLLNAGSEVLISDAYPPAIDRILLETEALPGNISVANNATIHAEAVEVFSPCALGNAISESSLADMQALVIAGAANNQLANQAAGELLFRKGITYAPDYVINAGGIIDIFYERGEYNHQKVVAHIDGISDTLSEIYALSKEHNKPTFEMADRLAESIFMGKSITGTEKAIA